MCLPNIIVEVTLVVFFLNFHVILPTKNCLLCPLPHKWPGRPPQLSLPFTPTPSVVRDDMVGVGSESFVGVDVVLAGNNSFAGDDEDVVA